MDMAGNIIEFIFTKTPHNENIDTGFFGGEPLLEFEILEKLTALIEGHPSYDANRVSLSVVTNGTLLSPSIPIAASSDSVPGCQHQHLHLSYPCRARL